MDAPVQTVKWYYGRIFVLVMLFVVFGPLALPFLWKSPRFTRPWKIALTVVVCAWTAVLLAGTVRSVSYMCEEIQRAIS